MTALAKWALAVTTMLLCMCLVFAGSLFDNAPSPKTPVKQPSSLQLAEGQLAKGLTLWGKAEYQQAAQVFSAIQSKALPANVQSLVALYQHHSQAFIAAQDPNYVPPVADLPSSCKQKILFVTPRFGSLPQAEYFRTRFAEDSRFTTLPICIYSRIWFDPLSISCQENRQQSGRIGCQMLPLAKKLKSLPFTHLVIFAENGKANVHNGIMFLDRQDTYDVFIHELAHFSGFVDEYPLNQSLAKRVCAGVEAPNMVFKQAKQSKADQQYWQSIGLQQNLHLYAARTCDNHPTQAYKASNKLTFMEYHDTAFIPAQYLNAWQQQLAKTPNQPSAHLNFAQLYEESNNRAESQFWRARYQQYIKPADNTLLNL